MQRITPEQKGVWRLRCSITRTAKNTNDGRFLIESFDTGKTYTNSFIAVGVSVSNSRKSWQYGGYLSQEFAFNTGSGYNNSNKAFNKTKDLLVNNVSIINLPLLSSSEYRLRYFPPNYFQSLKLKIWEYQGVTTNKLIEDLGRFLTELPPGLLFDLPQINQKLDRLIATQNTGVSVNFTSLEQKLDRLIACCEQQKQTPDTTVLKRRYQFYFGNLI